MQIKMDPVLVSESDPSATPVSSTPSMVNSALRNNSQTATRNSQQAATPQQTVLFTAPQQVKQGGTQTLALQQSNGNVSILHVQLPQNQSVIQPATTAQASVIQATSAGAIQSIGKNQVILVNKGSVIQSAGQQIAEEVPVQLVQGSLVSGGQLAEDEGTRKRREILARRPSYRKILNDLSMPQGEQGLSALQVVAGSSSDKDDASDSDYSLKQSTIQLQPATELAPQYLQYANDGTVFVPVTVSAADLQAYQIRPATVTGSMTGGGSSVVVASSGGSGGQTISIAEEAARKRELRLLKNREAAKECRRKKKDYIKCLENRVAVLENQNATLIEELKALKDLYCKKSVADV